LEIAHTYLPVEDLMLNEERPEYAPPAIIDYGDWAELTQHADPLSSPSHPAVDQHLTSSITDHH
jgi:hypothetical protein